MDRFDPQEFAENDERVRCFAIVAPNRPSKFQLSKVPRPPAGEVKWGPFDETLLSIDEEGSLFQWCARSGERLQSIEAHRRPAAQLQACSAQGDDRGLQESYFCST